jgi:hypothetical protein
MKTITIALLLASASMSFAATDEDIYVQRLNERRVYERRANERLYNHRFFERRAHERIDLTRQYNRPAANRIH